MMRAFERVLVIMFENQYRSYVMENDYFKGLAEQGIELANFFGVMHPSQTNYIASTAGALCNVTDDDRPSPLPQRNIVDLIEASPYGLTWRAYMESYVPAKQPWSVDLVPEDAYPYVIKHNPFSSFENIISNEARWAKVKDDAAFWQDVLNGTLPNYAWFTPNMWSDGHYLNGQEEEDPNVPRAPSLVDQAATWLEGFFGALRFPGPNSHLPDGTLVVVTFDEADFEADWDKDTKYTYDGPNQIYTVLLGDMIQPGVEHEGYNHYSVLRTIEENFRLGSLEKNDQDANWFQFLWQKRFEWSAPCETPICTKGTFDATSFQGSLMLLYTEDNGDLYSVASTDYGWTSPRPLEVRASRVAVASYHDTMMVFYTQNTGPNAGPLYVKTYTPLYGWSAPTQLAAQAQQVSACALADGIMVVFSLLDGAVVSRRWRNDGWEDAVQTGYCADGALTLNKLGASLLLIYKTEGQHTMQVATYNTQPFNVVTLTEGPYSGPWDDTTVDTWSPSVFPVCHFSQRPSPMTPGEPEPVADAYKAGGPLATCVLDGVLHLMHPGIGHPQILTETFSIHGLMTPKLPVSYDPAKNTTTSNGYGTLAQAGWSEQRLMPGHETQGALCATTVGKQALLLSQAVDGRLYISYGEYCVCSDD